MTFACLAAHSAREGAGDAAAGTASTSSRMMTPSSARQYSVCRMTVSCSTANTEAPTIGPAQRLDAAEQHHHQPVDRAADMHGLGRDRALGEGEQPAGDAADAAGDREGEPVHALDVDADRLGAQRRIAAGAHGIAERREQKRRSNSTAATASASVSRK